MTNELSMELEMETSGEVRPTPSPIMETNGENANKLRKERSKYFEDQKMEIRLQEIEDNHARQTQEQRQQSLAEDTKKIQELERMAREHLIGITDKMTRKKTKKNCTLVVKRSKHRKSRKEMEKRGTENARNRKE
jgi:hypothetical protein